jgi:DNA primase
MKTWVDFKAIREAASFEAILERYGIDGKREGRELLIRCPFHDDAKPSCRVNLEKKVFHCFACDAKGNALDFVALKEAVPVKRAAELVAEWFNLGEAVKAAPKGRVSSKKGKETTSEEEKKVSKASTTSPVSAPAENKPLTFVLQLDPDHPYLKEREVSPDVAKTFELGYCSRGVMRGRIAIPIHDAEGRVVAYIGRWPGEPPEGEERYKLPQGFHKSEVLFNLHRVKSEEHLVIVEGVWSVFRLHALGVSAIALLGRTLSPSQLRLLVDSGAKRISLLLDGDKPGRTAAAELLPRLALHFFVRVVNLPDDGEPDTTPDEELSKLLA